MIIELVEQRVRVTPRAVAIRSPEGDLTFDGLWRRAGAVASRLADLGCGPGEPIGVLAPPSLDGVVAVLAVLRIGAVHVGLCPSLPADRLGTMIRDSGAHYVLHGRTVPADLVPDAKPAAVFTDGRVPVGSGPPVPAGAHPLDPVALLYTSGSTGTPKGVLLPRRALRNRIEWGQGAYPLGPDDRVLHHTRYIYDFSLWEMLAPLAYGASLVVASFPHYPDFEELIAALRAFRVTAAHFVPSVLAGLLRRPSFRDCTALTTVFSGGEALPRALAADFQRLSTATLHNQYGPTETCVDSSWHRCGPVERGAGTVPIGVPIGRTRLYVLDDRLSPVPVGATGELYIGGAGLAIGYHRRPGSTAERFVPDPFVAGRRMYRTGDLVRVLDDKGCLEFVGRTDDQLNIRGVRLEAAEVEQVLEAHEDVLRAVVTRVEDPEPHLVAWVVPKPGARPAPASLRAAARAALPATAVPDRFHLGDRLPLLANGKLDRATVRELIRRAESEPAEPAAAPGGSAPVDGALADVIDIWRELLRVPEVGPDDDFFELGGHSLLAVELVAQINERLHADLALADFFERPDPRSVAHAIA
jgi:amino acid adenylation domain-containing protein